jgi:hypothetical protein
MVRRRAAVYGASVGIWYRSTGYRLFVILGLVAAVGVPIGLAVANADEPGSKAPLWGGIIAAGVLVIGVVLMQTRFLARDPGTGGGFADDDRPVASEADPPRGRALRDALAVRPIDHERLTAVEATQRRGVMSGMSVTLALVVAIFAGTALFYAGVDGLVRPFGETGPGLPYAYFPAFALVLLSVLRLPFAVSSAVGSGDSQLEPLGLGFDSIDQRRTTMRGDRHGREVIVRVGGDGCETYVVGDFPAFSVRADRRGTLVADAETPAAVREVLAGLSADPRWRSVRLTAGRDGIEVARRLRGAARTQSLWLDDLWLAELVVAAVQPDP